MKGVSGGSERGGGGRGVAVRVWSGEGACLEGKRTTHVVYYMRVVCARVVLTNLT